MAGVVPSTNQDWEVKSAADTLVRAEEIKTTPKLFKAAKNELVKRQQAAGKVLQKAPVKTTTKRTNSALDVNF